MGQTDLTLLLALNLLIHCVLSQDVTTVAPSTTRPSTSAPPAASSTPRITVTTRAPAAPPAHTAVPSKPPTTIAHPVVTTQKPSAPSSGHAAAGTQVITTVTKAVERPTTTLLSKSSLSSLAPLLRNTVSAHPQTTIIITTKPTPQTGAPTVPQRPGATVTTRASQESAPATTKAAAAPTDVPTKAAGTTAGVTSKSSPDQTSIVTGTTAPPVVAQTLQSTPEVSTAVTRQAPDHSTKTREQTTVRTPIQTTVQTPIQSTVQTPIQTPVQTRTQTTVQTTAASSRATVSTTVPSPRIFSYRLNKGHQSEEEKELVVLCQRLMSSLEDGNCTVSFRHYNDRMLFDSVEVSGKVKMTIVTQQFEDITKKPTDNRTLITILASCGALLIMIIVLAVCASHHRKPYSENQLHLTEELQTVENGYHDNPTLEVMEVMAVEQEKKLPPPCLNNGGGDFNDSWIVPIDNLLKEEGPEEEDTHL